MMGYAIRLQSIFTRILLVTVAIQGMAPDATDLASGRALGVICSVLGNTSFLRFDDGAKLEVCGPAQREAMQVMKRGVEAPEGLGFEPKGSASPINALASSRLSHPNTNGLALLDDLVQSLCRLRC